jgi:hypothetical protein
LIRPSFTAIENAIGKEAATQLPNSDTISITLSSPKIPEDLYASIALPDA